MFGLLVIMLNLLAQGLNLCILPLAHHKALVVGFPTGMKNYRNNLYHRNLVDTIQLTFKCCGSQSYEDWLDLDWVDPYYHRLHHYKSNKRLLEFKSSLPRNYTYIKVKKHVLKALVERKSLPWSCCPHERLCVVKDAQRTKLGTVEATARYDFVEVPFNEVGCLKQLDYEPPWPSRIPYIEMRLAFIDLLHLILILKMMRNIRLFTTSNTFAAHCTKTYNKSRFWMLQAEHPAPAWIFCLPSEDELQDWYSRYREAYLVEIYYGTVPLRPSYLSTNDPFYDTPLLDFKALCKLFWR
ncbi:hypothetical protein Pmani_002685 [Petrolisthes manimaculis]|uniref:Uncharacterized protein n=1 Tax=Petrolisthes manimaculis TaxID=1843537 RepID=A0AAE1QH24_9EUCA|nr:hypothetical protein Pmani_002685 [Petrolisthes manimaculis]